MFTGHPSLETARETLRHGQAFDYVPKVGTRLSELSTVLNAALEHRRKRQDQSPSGSSHSPSALLEDLTRAERDVAELLLEGHTTKHMADRLGVTQGTVRNRLSVIYQKLGVSDRVAAIAALR